MNVNMAAKLQQFKQKKRVGKKDPVDTDSNHDVEAIRSELHSIYTEHCPEKLDKLDKVMVNFAGREEELLKKVRAKYTTKAPVEQTEKELKPEQEANPAEEEDPFEEEKTTSKAAPTKIPTATCKPDVLKASVPTKASTGIKPPMSKVVIKTNVQASKVPVASSKVAVSARPKQGQPNKSYRDLKRSEVQLQEEVTTLKSEMVAIKDKHRDEMADSARIANSDARLDLLKGEMVEQAAASKAEHAKETAKLEEELAQLKKREADLCRVVENNAVDSVQFEAVSAVELAKDFVQAEAEFVTQLDGMLQQIKTAETESGAQMQRMQLMVRRLNGYEHDAKNADEQQTEQQEQEHAEESEGAISCSLQDLQPVAIDGVAIGIAMEDGAAADEEGLAEGLETTDEVDFGADITHVDASSELVVEQQQHQQQQQQQQEEEQQQEEQQEEEQQEQQEEQQQQEEEEQQQQQAQEKQEKEQKQQQQQQQQQQEEEHTAVEDAEMEIDSADERRLLQQATMDCNADRFKQEIALAAAADDSFLDFNDSIAAAPSSSTSSSTSSTRGSGSRSLTADEEAHADEVLVEGGGAIEKEAVIDEPLEEVAKGINGLFVDEEEGSEADGGL
jgi:hypothetical protein